MHNLRIVAVFLIVVFSWASAAQAFDPGTHCQKRKLKLAGKYANCRLKAEAKGVGVGEAPDYSECAEVLSRWAREETRAGEGICPTEGDDAAMDARITRDTAMLAASLTGIRYEDTGLGTVIDHQTGLEWQKTDDAGGLTDKDNTFTWQDSRIGDKIAPDGTAFTEFLGGLNAGVRRIGREFKTVDCYAGHCDWRMPLVEELATIVDCTLGQPCIDQAIFGPMFGGEDAYPSWSATTIEPPFEHDSAWTVDFWRGDISAEPKSGELFVRAVRNAR